MLVAKKKKMVHIENEELMMKIVNSSFIKVCKYNNIWEEKKDEMKQCSISSSLIYCDKWP